MGGAGPPGAPTPVAARAAGRDVRGRRAFACRGDHPRLPSKNDGGLRARLLAAVLLTALRIAVQQWIEHSRAGLADVLASALDAAGSRWS